MLSSATPRSWPCLYVVIGWRAGLSLFSTKFLFLLSPITCAEKTVSLQLLPIWRCCRLAVAVFPSINARVDEHCIPSSRLQRPALSTVCAVQPSRVCRLHCGTATPYSCFNPSAFASPHARIGARPQLNSLTRQLLLLQAPAC